MAVYTANNKEFKIQESDKKIGQRLKVLRSFSGVTQKALAETLNVSFQQVQKYENGVNRISIIRGQRAAELFGLPFTALLKPMSCDEEVASFVEGVRLEQKYLSFFEGLDIEKRSAFVEAVEQTHQKFIKTKEQKCL